MGVFFDENKLVIIEEPKTIHIDLHVKINENIENDIRYMVSRNESLADYAIKNQIRQLLFKYAYEHKKKIT